MTSLPERLPLARLPTPLERCDRLTEAWGGPRIWVKRDDLTGFGISGNKIRKLEFHFAAARAAGAETVVTCGAVQSNHCRATALVAAKLGLHAVLFLRSPDGEPPSESTGNHLLSHLAGAAIRYVTPDQYRDRDALMADAARDAGRSWVIPEGASDALGMWGFVLAMQELADQMTTIGRPARVVWHAASSGGTTAGMAWAADRLQLASEVVGSSVGEAAAELGGRVEAIWDEASARYGGRRPEAPWSVVDEYIGEGYGVAKAAELAAQVEATSLTGMIFDPTYTGKALYALREEIRRGRYGPGDDVVFWHTGGGFAVFAHDFGFPPGGRSDRGGESGRRPGGDQA